MTSEPNRESQPFYSELEGALGHPDRGAQLGAQALGAPGAVCRFTIVIPALNEEQAIGHTLSNVLETRQQILDQTPVSAVNVVVVNDGSTDQTQHIAESFEDVTVIRFEKNRGYGAAIKAGFLADRAELVGFMDADGTLRAESWIPLLRKLFEDGADVVLGARLNSESDMPLIRRAGNWMFARLIGLISGQSLTDCASGMRVIRRASLRYLVPLPDGLHFTPAMSCNALMDKRITIREVPIPYAERTGRSKLSVLRDGLRFLTIILLTGCFYHPLKCVAMGLVISWVAAVIAWLVGWDPLLLLPAVLGMDVVALGTALICHQAVKALIVADPPRGAAERLLHVLIRPRALAHTGFALLALCAMLTLALLAIGPQAHRWLAGSALLVCFGGVTLVLLGISLRMIFLIRQKFEALMRDPFMDPRR